MSRGARAIPGFVAFVLALPAAAPAGAATGSIVCESRGYKYEYCNVDTQGQVRIVREVSTGNLCRQGISWNLDHHTVQLIVQGNGRVTLRDQHGGVVNTGDFIDGLIYWSDGRRSWFAREGPGVILGNVDSAGHYRFRRS